MTHSRVNQRLAFVFGWLAVSAGVAGGQPAATGRGGVAASAPAAGRQPIMAKVIELHGDVRYAPLKGKYRPCKLGDTYPAGTKIITGVRSSIKFQIGEEEPYTCLLIDAVGKTVISEAWKDQTTKKVRVGVGYGRIRAGVAEGGLKSDFTVDSPVATLSKRGTWGFSLYYERDSDYFEIGLADRGLVEAIDKLRNQRRAVRPREFVTAAMRMWLDQAQFQRNVPIPDMLGQGDITVAFNRIKQAGVGVVGPGEGPRVLLNLSNASARDRFARLARRHLLPPPGAPPRNRNQIRPEGLFGTGRGDELVQIMIDQASPLVQRGMARPGRYLFRRAALRSWLREYEAGRMGKP